MFPRSRGTIVTTVASGLVAAMALASCGSGGSSAGDEPRRTNEVTIAINGDERTSTPYTQQSGYPGNNLVALVYDLGSHSGAVLGESYRKEGSFLLDRLAR